jgi:nucleotide-binding universal stress UspA family protein
MNKQAETERFVVLAALEGDFAEHVALVGARFARAVKSGELHLVHVITLPPVRGAEAPSAFDRGRSRLERIGLFAGKIHRGRVVGHLTDGDPSHEILQLAARIKADMILVGTHSRTGIDRWLMGSVAERVMRRASCPVLVVREKDYNAGLAPEIEPPCPDCVEVQRETEGARMWCAHHSQRHLKRHTHYEIPQPFALGSSIIRPS